MPCCVYTLSLSVDHLYNIIVHTCRWTHGCMWPSHVTTKSYIVLYMYTMTGWPGIILLDIEKHPETLCVIWETIAMKSQGQIVTIKLIAHCLSFHHCVYRMTSIIPGITRLYTYQILHTLNRNYEQCSISTRLHPTGPFPTCPAYTYLVEDRAKLHANEEMCRRFPIIYDSNPNFHLVPDMMERLTYSQSS